VLLSAWAAICLFPLYWILITSIKVSEFEPDGSTFLPFIDFSPSLESWRYILFDSHDETMFRFTVSLAVASSSTGLTVALAAPAAFALARGLPGVPAAPRLSLLIMLATRILPPYVIILPIYILLQRLNILDSPVGLIVVYTVINLPISLWLLQEGFAMVPAETLDAAALDGATNIRQLWDIALPLSRSELWSAALFVFFLCWNEYPIATMLTAGHAQTLPAYLVAQMAVREQMASTEPQWGNFSAIIVLMVAPLLLCTGVMTRFLTGKGNRLAS